MNSNNMFYNYDVVISNDSTDEFDKLASLVHLGESYE